ncbi:MAG: hypothetical protein NC340_01095 [Ruminococcus flavefaciens]|nr:hypothetical protein [Ruminococcus flavefaciens]MCM1228742.1 hypothetical protein [Ruminococcus flavefaciens]
MKKNTGIIIAVGIILSSLAFAGCANKAENNNSAESTFFETESTAEESSDGLEEESAETTVAETTVAETTVAETTKQATTTRLTTTAVTTTATARQTTTAKTFQTTKAATTAKEVTNVTWKTNNKTPALTTAPVTTATLPIKASDYDFQETSVYVYTDEQLDEVAEAALEDVLRQCETSNANIAYLGKDFTFDLSGFFSEFSSLMTREQFDILCAKINVLLNEAIIEAMYNETGITFERTDNNTVNRIQKNIGADGLLWTHTIELFDSEYQNFKQRPRYTDISEWANYIYENEGLTNNIAGGMLRYAEEIGKTKDEMLLEAIVYVQSIPYELDIDSTGYVEYPKYPYETLYENCGDCEDLSFLLAGLLRSMGYGVCLVHPEGHMAVGVRTDDKNANFYFDGLGYYYIECTNEGWLLGQVPEDCVGNAKVYIID